MAILGRYETVSELFRTGLGTVSTARLAGGETEVKYVVKAVQPGLMLDEDQSRQESEAFLDAAQTQQKVAAQSKLWAPVHECGLADDGAYYVTEYYRRSLQQVIIGKVRMTSPGLCAVVTRIVQGLRDLRDTCGRPYGNLKPTNVLIAGEGDLAAAQVVLTDPLPANRLEAARDESADLRALGELIFQLVMYRPFRTMGVWPVQESEEWKRLGGVGEGWRQLCNSLLEPNVKPGSVTLDDIATRLPKLRGRKGGSRVPAVVGVLVLLLGGAGAGLYFFGDRLWPSKPKEAQVGVSAADWERLCQEYNTWAGAFMEKADADHRKKWGQDGYLKEHVLPALDRIVDPRKIANQPGVPLKALGSSPPSEALVGEGGRQTVQTLQAMDQVRTALTAERWELLGKVPALTGRFRDRGWGKPAGYLTYLLADAKLEAKARTVEGLDAILAANALEDRWAEANTCFEKIKAAGVERKDEILQAFPAYAKEAARSEAGLGTPADFADLTQRLKNLLGLGTEVQTIASRLTPARLDWPAFIERSKVHKDYRAGGKAVSEMAFRMWVSEIQDPAYAVNPGANPFNDPWWDQSIASASSSLGQVLEFEKNLDEGNRKAGEMQKKQDALKRLREEGQNVVSSGGRLEQLKEQERQARTEMDALRKLVGERLAFLNERPAEPDPRVDVKALLDRVSAKINSVPSQDARRVSLESKLTDAGKDLKPLMAYAYTRAYLDAINRDKSRLDGISQTLTGLEKAVDDIIPKDDPRPALLAVRNAVEAGLGELTDKLKDPLGPVKPREELDSVKKDKEFWDTPWSQVDKRPTIEQRSTQVKTVLADLRGRVQKRIDVVGRLRGIKASAVTGSPAIEEAWQKKRDEMIATVAAPDQLDAKVKEYQAYLAGLDQAFAKDLAISTAPGDWSASDAGKAFSTKRETSIRQALAGGPDANASAKSFNDWQKDAVAMVQDFKQAQGLLDGAYGLDEAPAAGKSLAALYDAWKDKAVFKDLRPVLGRTPDRGELLRQIEKMNETQLVEQANRTDDPAPAFQAWRKLGDPNAAKAWPDEISNLREELKIADKLKALVEGRIQDAGRKKALTGELAAGAQTRWQRCVGFLPAQDVDEATALRKDFGVDDLKLEPWLLYNVMLYDLRRKDFSKMPEKQAKDEIDQFAQLIRAIPGKVADRPQVADLLKGMEDLKTQKGPGLDLSKAGPAAAGWTTKDDPESPTLTFTHAGMSEKLEFLQIQPKTGDAKPFYLSATEIPVGLFSDVLVAGKNIDAMKKLLTSRSEFRDGPVVWEWDATGTGIQESPEWLDLGPDVPRGKEYPEGLNPTKPTRGHPVQRLSPASAIYFSRLVGCRLPTSGEWKEAYAQYEKSAAPTGRNLRDQLWKMQLDHVSKLRSEAKRGLKWPDAGAFWPKDFPDDKRKEGKDATVALDTSDGILWFAPVRFDSEKKLHHLVGNVAEYVYDDDAGADQLKDLSEASINQFVKNGASKWFVIGGSGLSPPELQIDTPHPVNLEEAKDGYCDVGMRLAFSAPSESLSSKLKRLLANQKYLTKG
jgi:hypothetical protein